MSCFFSPNKFIDIDEEKLDELDNFMREFTSNVKETGESMLKRWNRVAPKEKALKPD